MTAVICPGCGKMLRSSVSGNGGIRCTTCKRQVRWVYDKKTRSVQVGFS